METDQLKAAVAKYSVDDIRTHAAAAINATEIVEHPYAHLVVDGVLPGDFYDAFIASIPPREAFSGNNPNLPQDQQHTLFLNYHGYVDLSSSHHQAFNRIQAAQRTVSERFLVKFQPYIGQAFTEIFSSEGPRNIARISVEHVPVAGIYERNARYTVGPHLDGHFRLVSWIYYMPIETGGSRRGTELYRIVERGPEFDPIETMYLRESSHLTLEVEKTVEMRPNRAFAFISSPSSFHAVAPLEPDTLETGRRLTFLNWIELRKDSAEHIYGDAIFRSGRFRKAAAPPQFKPLRSLDPATLVFAADTPHDDRLWIETRPRQWCYAAWIPIERLVVGVPSDMLQAEVELESGAVGVSIQHGDDETFLTEYSVSRPGDSTVHFELPDDRRPVRLLFRNQAEEGISTRFRIGTITLGR